MGIYTDRYNFYFQPYSFDIYSDYFSSHSLFFRPKLRIEHENHREEATFYPQRTYMIAGTLPGSYRYARIRVRNKGHRMLHNCQAQLRVIIPTADDPLRYPSDDSKLLTWGRSPERTDLTETRDIQGHSAELLFVVFSDSIFPTQDVAAPTRYASVAILDRIARSVLAIVDSFTNGYFVIEIIVTSDEGPYARKRFRINMGTDWEDLRMTRISRFERIITLGQRFIRFLARRQPN